MRAFRRALILAAGLGTRLYPLTADRPKAMVNFLDKPMIGRAVDALSRAGIEEFGIVVGHMHDVIRSFFSGHSQESAITYFQSEQFAQTGTAYSTLLAADFLTENTIILEGDVVFDERLPIYLVDVATVGSCIAVAPFREPLEGTTVALSPAGHIEGFMRGTPVGTNPDRFKTINMHALSWRDLRILLHWSQEIVRKEPKAYLEDVLDVAVKGNHLCLRAEIITDFPWAEVDTPDDLAWAVKHFSGTA